MGTQDPAPRPDTAGNGHHDREMTIVVNTREMQVSEREMTFEQLVALAFPSAPSGPNVLITVS